MSGESDAIKGRCPICSKSAVRKYRPFCSARCADIDLNRWLRGVYAVPALEEPDPEEEPGNGGPRESGGQS
ncbi:MAG: DNA gyrase inhibitor YacG [Parvibaculaceae bacterium]